VVIDRPKRSHIAIAPRTLRLTLRITLQRPGSNAEGTANRPQIEDHHTMAMDNPTAAVSDADLIRARLQAAELSQREAARLLGIDERAMRRYCAGSAPVPPLLFLALDRLGQIWRNNRVIEMLDDETLSTSDGPLTRDQFEHHNEVLRQANEKLLRAINFLIDGEPDPYRGTTNDLDTFEGWLKHQGFVVEGTPADLVSRWRADFESGKARREVARSAVFFNQPCPAGEYRYAVAIEDGAELRLALVVRRSRKGEYFILMPRDGDWNPHASYHRLGQYHQKSFDQKMMVQQRQRLDQFTGTEHLGSFMGFGAGAAPICHPANFTSVLEVPPGILESTHGHVLIDLVEPGVAPKQIHRENPGLRITDEKTFRDGSPWVVIAVAAQTPFPRR
jgi:transcriptional regulator with XRE-family HTH domain